MSDDFRESFDRVVKERKEYEEGKLTPLQRAERNQQEDVMLVILVGNALFFVCYYMFSDADDGILWVPILSLGLALIALILRFRRKLH